MKKKVEHNPFSDPEFTAAVDATAIPEEAPAKKGKPVRPRVVDIYKDPTFRAAVGASKDKKEALTAFGHAFLKKYRDPERHLSEYNVMQAEKRVFFDGVIAKKGMDATIRYLLKAAKKASEVVNFQYLYESTLTPEQMQTIDRRIVELTLKENEQLRPV